MTTQYEPRWTLTPEAFDRLLSRLADDREAAGREYDAIRRRLVLFFVMRGAVAAETLADQAIDRMARRLDEGEAIDHPKAYVFGVAKRVWLEEGKRRAREQTYVEGHVPAPLPADPAELVESRLACLHRCLQALPEDRRALITAYYEGAGASYLKERKRLAITLGTTYGALKVRAHRVRNQLEICVRECLERTAAVTDAPPAPPGSR